MGSQHTERPGLYAMVLVALIWTLITMFNTSDIRGKVDQLLERTQPCTTGGNR